MWTLDEAAERLGYHRNYIRQLCREGKLRAHKQGRGRQAPWIVMDLKYTPLSLVPDSGVKRNGGHDQRARVAAGNRTIAKNYLQGLLASYRDTREAEAIQTTLNIIDRRVRPPRGLTRNTVLEFARAHPGQSITVAMISQAHPLLRKQTIRVTLLRLVERKVLERPQPGVFRFVS